MNPNEFVPTVAARVKEIRDLKRQGRDAKPEEFVAVPHLRKIGELKDELNTGVQAPIVVKDNRATTAEEGFAAGIRWALHMDSASIAAAKAKDEARRKQLAEERLKRQKEQAEKKQQDASSKMAELTEKAKSEHTKPLVAVAGN